MFENNHKDLEVATQYSKRSYVPAIDTLRWYAVLGVLITHFVPSGVYLRDFVPWGSLGVLFFFGLSGYLITNILLLARLKSKNSTATRKIIINFYIRRVLRLFPLYYLYLLFAFVAIPTTRSYLWYFFLYLQNFLFARDEVLFGKALTHFWTLAVEEQFYLFLPFLLLFVPLDSVIRSLLAIVVLGICFRLFGLFLDYTPFQIGMMMPAYLDTFGIGGLFAAIRLLDQDRELNLVRVSRVGGVVLLVAFLGLHSIEGSEALRMLIGPLAAGLFFTSLLSSAINPVWPVWRSLLNCPVTVYLGRISYGIYVIHFNVPGLLTRLNVAVANDVWFNFVIFTLATILLASLTWYACEDVINRSKRFFPL